MLVFYAFQLGHKVTGVLAAPVVDDEQPTGGWWYTYDLEYEIRERKRKKRERLEVKAEEIKDTLDRALAIELRKQDKERDRISELRRLSQLAQKHQDELRKTVSHKALQAAEAAFKSGSYSMLERMERELARSKEEEEFLIHATSIILNS